jgi:hypothetical protein
MLAKARGKETMSIGLVFLVVKGLFSSAGLDP